MTVHRRRDVTTTVTRGNHPRGCPRASAWPTTPPYDMNHPLVPPRLLAGGASPSTRGQQKLTVANDALSCTSPLIHPSPHFSRSNSASTSRSDSPACAAEHGWDTRLRAGAGSPPPDAHVRPIKAAQTVTPPPIRRPLCRRAGLFARAETSEDLPVDMIGHPTTPPTFSGRAVPSAPRIDMARNVACIRRDSPTIDMDMLAEALIPSIPLPPSMGPD